MMIHSLQRLSALCLGCLLLLFTGCKQTMVISDVNYAQPIETVLTPSEDGVVEDIQNGLTFNILPLQYSETQDTSSVTTREVRMIRGQEGFYYITAAGYSNVYVMAPEKNRLKLKKKIAISENGIQNPAFNQRDAFVQLLDRDTKDTYMLTEEGVQETEKEFASNKEN